MQRSSRSTLTVSTIRMKSRKFLEKYRATNADLIIGARDFSQMPLVRRISNTLGRRAFSWAMGRPIRDNQSGYRLLSRRADGSRAGQQ